MQPAIVARGRLTGLNGCAWFAGLKHTEFPWLQIRSVLVDVIRIGQQAGQGAQA